MKFYIAAYSRTDLLNYMLHHRIQPTEVHRVSHPNDLRGIRGGNLYVLCHPYGVTVDGNIEHMAIDRRMKIVDINYDTTKEQLIQFEQEKE